MDMKTFSEAVAAAAMHAATAAVRATGMTSINTATGTQQPQQSQTEVHLPKLVLPTFSGNILEWPDYWERFTSAVDDRPHLSDVSKFNYLKSTLSGSAAKSIKSIAVTSTNYLLAKKTLLEKFGRPDEIVTALLASSH